MIERHAHSRVEYMIKARSQFKRRSTANHVEVVVPVPADADSPKFKTSVGSVRYVPEQNVLIWSIKSFPVSSNNSWRLFLRLLKGFCNRISMRSCLCVLYTLDSLFWLLFVIFASPMYRGVRNILCGLISAYPVSSARKRKASRPFKWNLRSPISLRQAFR